MKRGSHRSLIAHRRRARLALGAIVVALATGFTSGQSSAPAPPPQPAKVRWSIAQDSKTPARAGSTFKVIVTATIARGWHLYAMTQPPAGPVPLAIDVPKSPVFSLGGPVVEPPSDVQLDPNSNLETRSFENAATLTVPVRVAAGAVPGPATLRLAVEFQACSDRLCLPPATVELKLDITVGAPAAAGTAGQPAEPWLEAAVAGGAVQGPEARLSACCQDCGPASGRVAVGSPVTLRTTYGICRRRNMIMPRVGLPADSRGQDPPSDSVVQKLASFG